MKVNLFFKCLLLSIVCSILSCGPNDPPSLEPQFPLTNQFDYQVYWKWNELFKTLDRHAYGYRPCPAPRALAYLGLSAYESVVPGMPFHKSLAPVYGLTLPQADHNLEYKWPECVNESYAYLMERFFPHLQNSPNPAAAAAFAEIAVLRTYFQEEFSEGTTKDIINRSEKFGQEVAAAIYTWSKTDLSGHNAFLDPQSQYTPSIDPGNWQPTFPDFSKAYFQNFGHANILAMHPDDLLCSPPIPYSEDPASPLYVQALEPFNAVNTINNPPPGLADWAAEQHWISEFWSDDNLYSTFSAGTRWISIADQMVANENLDLATCAELYAKLGLALNDVTIAVWKSKYYYAVERPISYIRRELPMDYPAAADWYTLLNNPINGAIGITPAYPSYPSAHAGFGGSGAKILASFLENAPGYGGNYIFTDRSHEFEINLLGAPRQFISIAQMGEECAFSRISLGVNYRMDCEKGLELGRLAAQRVLELPWKK